jgi:hypothetical protein
MSGLKTNEQFKMSHGLSQANGTAAYPLRKPDCALAQDLVLIGRPPAEAGRFNRQQVLTKQFVTIIPWRAQDATTFRYVQKICAGYAEGYFGICCVSFPEGFGGFRWFTYCM